MNTNKHRMIACLARAAAVAAFVAVHTGAQAQMSPPALFVAPEFTTVAAPAGAPAATPAVMSRPSTPQSSASVPTVQVACSTPLHFSRFERPLLRTMRRLASGDPLTIVAIGSSSTAGAGASSLDATYPSRLAVELRKQFPGHDITVLNRGVNGEETNDMMARFQTEVIAEHPQLVLWQVGTNSVLRDRPLTPHLAELREGIDELKATGADIVLIDPQYAPAVIAKSETTDMVDQIAAEAKNKNVDLFQRFAVMRDWHETQHLPFDIFVSADQLHMNDWGYGCWAKLMAAAISEAATRPITSAAAPAAHATISP
jgi:acyl-CoA thioesterase-1